MKALSFLAKLASLPLLAIAICLPAVIVFSTAAVFECGQCGVWTLAMLPLPFAPIALVGCLGIAFHLRAFAQD